jgi:hypothetical protein
MKKSAIISQDGLYRYSLTREWDEGVGTVAFIGLNPSTADDTLDDPTIRRCIGFARSWGYSGLIMLNLFAYRATDPKNMMSAADPVGPENDKHIKLFSEIAAEIVCAWGAHGSFLKRNTDIDCLIPAHRLKALKLTKDGHPSHPLYLPKNLKPLTFSQLKLLEINHV